MTMYTEEALGVPMQKQTLQIPPAVRGVSWRGKARCERWRRRHHGARFGPDQYMDIAMRDLINRGEMIGPRMFVCGYGLYITNTPFKKEGTPPAGRDRRWRTGSVERRCASKLRPART